MADPKFPPRPTIPIEPRTEQDKTVSYADMCLAFYQRLPKLEGDLDETKGIALAAMGGLGDCKLMLRTLLDAKGLKDPTRGRVQRDSTAPQMYDLGDLSPTGSFKIPEDNFEKLRKKLDRADAADRYEHLLRIGGKIFIGVVIAVLATIIITRAVTAKGEPPPPHAVSVGH